MIFWFGHLYILKANGLDVTTHERELSMEMIHDLAYFARFSRMPWLPYQVGHTTPHIYDKREWDNEINFKKMLFLSHSLHYASFSKVNIL